MFGSGDELNDALKHMSYNNSEDKHYWELIIIVIFLQFIFLPILTQYFYVLCVFAGVLGIKVKIMLPWDQTGKIGPKKPLPDNVSIVEPKEETIPTAPYSESKQQAPPPMAAQ